MGSGSLLYSLHLPVTWGEDQWVLVLYFILCTSQLPGEKTSGFWFFTLFSAPPSYLGRRPVGSGSLLYSLHLPFSHRRSSWTGIAIPCVWVVPYTWVLFPLVYGSFTTAGYHSPVCMGHSLKLGTIPCVFRSFPTAGYHSPVCMGHSLQLGTTPLCVWVIP